MRIYTNPDKEYANEIKKQLKANSGYCPCALLNAESKKFQKINVCAKSSEKWRRACVTAAYT